MNIVPPPLCGSEDPCADANHHLLIGSGCPLWDCLIRTPRIGLIGTDTAFHRRQVNYDVRPGILVHKDDSPLFPKFTLPPLGTKISLHQLVCLSRSATKEAKKPVPPMATTLLPSILKPLILIAEYR